MSVQTYKDGELQLLAGAPIQMKVMAFPGQIVMGANIATPTGWLKCDGTAYSQVDYPLLFAAIGTQYNAPDTPEGQFCVPDMRGRYALGASATEPVGEKIAEQLPNITGKFTTGDDNNYSANAITSVSGTFSYIGNDPRPRSMSTKPSESQRPLPYRVIFDAKKTLNKNNSDDISQWTTIDNPAYKDPVNGVPVKVRPDSMTLNYYIKY